MLFFLLGELIPLIGLLIGRRFPPTANLFPLALKGGGRRVVVIPIGMAVVETGGGGGRNPFCSSPAKRFPCRARLVFSEWEKHSNEKILQN